MQSNDGVQVIGICDSIQWPLYKPEILLVNIELFNLPHAEDRFIEHHRPQNALYGIILRKLTEATPLQPVTPDSLKKLNAQTQ